MQRIGCCTLTAGGKWPPSKYRALRCSRPQLRAVGLIAWEPTHCADAPGRPRAVPQDERLCRYRLKRNDFGV